MKVEVYKQSYEGCLEFDIDVIEEHMQIECQDCDGGIFYITEDEYFTCVCCRGTNKIWVNMY